jgi:hypothetical protein
MACTFSTVLNNCGCTVGYTLPLQTPAGEAITAYPVDVLSVAGLPLGTANSPSEYALLWNASAANALIGTLYVGTGAYCFYIVVNAGQTVPEFGLGVDNSSFLATENNDPILTEDNNLIEP